MKKYILFEYDHGGTNNVIISFKFIIFLSYLTNRTVVIPKPQSIYHFDWGPNGLKSYNVIEKIKNDDDIVEEVSIEYDKEFYKDFYEDITKTDLNDILDIEKYKSFTDIISFEQFCNEIDVPDFFKKCDRSYSDYQTMKIQGERLQELEPNGRYRYWLDRYKNFPKYCDSKKDWTIYSLDNFKALELQDKLDIKTYIENFVKLNDKVIFIPMDVNYCCKNYKYPRLFSLVVKYNLQNSYQKWNDIITKTYYKNYFMDITNKIINDLLGNEYAAFHHRHNNFNEKTKKSGRKLMFHVQERITEPVLYIACDSFKERFKHVKFRKLSFKVYSSKDLEIYQIDKKNLVFVEILICIKSNTFIGTNISTMTGEIINNRTNKCYYYRNLDKQIKNDKRNIIFNKDLN